MEVFGCAVALIGGLILGSMYFGIDVKEVTVKALQHAKIMSPPEAPAVDPAAVSVDVHTAVSAALQEAGQGPVQPTAPPKPPEDLADALALPAEQRHELTLAYWTALDECMKNELAGRTAANAKSSDLQVYDYLTLRNQGPPKTPAPKAPTPLKTRRSKNWALYEYLTLRNKGHQDAADAIEALDVRGVDGHITAYAEKALAWHREGAELFKRALDLLTDAPSAQLSGPFAQAWQSKATQHQMEERLLADKHQAVQSYLDHGNHSGSDVAN
ncbi:MAG: hypothetical protein C0485_10695 [Pirellula sp.]|nr:hypothetical protein [Pirellula sp.]